MFRNDNTCHDVVVCTLVSIENLYGYKKENPYMGRYLNIGSHNLTELRISLNLKCIILCLPYEWNI